MTATSTALATPVAQEVRQIPIAQLVPSPVNPRKTMDGAFLAQLADSIQQLGVQVPLLVRRIPGNAVNTNPRTFEIIAGHRRHQAALALKLGGLPCIVREMSDAEALQVMIVENLQRADLSPMEEADGYRVLVRAMGDPDPQACVEEIARKSGKPAGYVRSRLKLLGLIAPAQEALREQLITFDAALLIAKLEPEDQDKATARALNYAVPNNTAQKALDGVRESIADDKEWRTEHPDEDEEPAHEPLPAARLKAWISENVLLDLAKAPWPLDDAGVLPKAGPCTTCPKRAGSDAALFADLTAKQDVCTDPACFNAKKKAFVQIKTAAAKASGRPLLKLSDSFSQAPLKEGAELEKTTFKSGQWVAAKAGECAGTYQGLTPEGELRWVCVLQTCKVHKHTIQQAAARGAGVSVADQERMRAEVEARRKLIAEAESAIRDRIWLAILGKLDAEKAVRLIAATTSRSPEIRKKLLALFPKMNGLTLEALAAFWCVFGASLRVNDWWMARNPAGVRGDREKLWELAKASGVNADLQAAQHFHAAGEIPKGLEDLYPKGVPWPKSAKAPAKQAKASPAVPAKSVKASPARKPAPGKAKPAKVTKKPAAKKSAKKGGGK